MRSLRRQLMKLRWPILVLLLLQLFTQVLVTAHASEHEFHAQDAYCEALEHADHQQGDGIEVAPVAITLLELDSREGIPDVDNVFVPQPNLYHQRAPPAYLF